MDETVALHVVEQRLAQTSEGVPSSFAGAEEFILEADLRESSGAFGHADVRNLENDPIRRLGRGAE